MHIGHHFLNIVYVYNTIEGNFSHRMSYILSSEINFEVNMISRTQENEKSSHPPATYFGPPRLLIFRNFFQSFPKMLLSFSVKRVLTQKNHCYLKTKH